MSKLFLTFKSENLSFNLVNLSALLKFPFEFHYASTCSLSRLGAYLFVLKSCFLLHIILKYTNCVDVEEIVKHIYF